MKALPSPSFPSILPNCAILHNHRATCLVKQPGKVKLTRQPIGLNQAIKHLAIDGISSLFVLIWTFTVSIFLFCWHQSPGKKTALQNSLQRSAKPTARLRSAGPRCTRHENVPPSHAEKRGPSCFIFYYSCPQFRVFGADRTFPNSTDGPTRKTKRQISKLPLGPFKVFFACHPNSVDDPGPIIQTQASDPDTFTVTLQVVI